MSNEVRIDFRGKSGSGKSTLLRLVAEFLKSKHYVVIEGQYNLASTAHSLTVPNAKPFAKFKERDRDSGN